MVPIAQISGTNTGLALTDAIDAFDTLSAFQKTNLYVDSITKIDAAYNKLTPNWIKHDFHPRNWEYNSHSLLVELPNNATRDNVIAQLYAKIQTFELLDVEGNNNTTIQLSGTAPDGTSLGFFTVKGTELVPGALNPFSIDVQIEPHNDLNEIQVATIGNHPLVGSRKFRAEPVGANQILIITEAWEHSANRTAEFGKVWGPPVVDQLWSRYVENLTEFAEGLGASRVSRPNPATPGISSALLQRGLGGLEAGIIENGVLIQTNANPFINDFRIPRFKVSGYLPGSAGSQVLRDSFTIKALFEGDSLYLKSFNSN